MNTAILYINGGLPFYVGTAPFQTRRTFYTGGEITLSDAQDSRWSTSYARRRAFYVTVAGRVTSLTLYRAPAPVFKTPNEHSAP